MLEATGTMCGPLHSDKEDLLREQLKLHRDRLKALLAKQHGECSHMQGSNKLGASEGFRTSIVWHLFDDGLMRGFCTNCGKYFLPYKHNFPYNREFIYWYRKPSGNKLSAGGLTDSIESFAQFVLGMELDRVKAVKEASERKWSDIWLLIKNSFKNMFTAKG